MQLITVLCISASIDASIVDFPDSQTPVFSKHFWMAAFDHAPDYN